MEIVWIVFAVVYMSGFTVRFVYDVRLNATTDTYHDLDPQNTGIVMMFFVLKALVWFVCCKPTHRHTQRLEGASHVG
jgi:hypothetical protein